MSASIVIESLKLCTDGRQNLDMLSMPWRLFLRKAAAYFAKESR